MHQLDVNNAFQHGDRHEKVYMKVPDLVPNPDNKVCLLKKSLYGLKQDSRQWHARLVNELINLGYKQSKNDYSLFTKFTSKQVDILTVYIDDILITGDNHTKVDFLKKHLHEVFTIKDLGHLHYFTGIEVSKINDSLVLTQQKYTKELLQSSGATQFKRVVIPLPLNTKLSVEEGTLLADPTIYRSIVGKLNFLTNTRPDLSYSVQTLSQFMQKPRTSH